MSEQLRQMPVLNHAIVIAQGKAPEAPAGECQRVKSSSHKIHPSVLKLEINYYPYYSTIFAVFNEKKEAFCLVFCRTVCYPVDSTVSRKR